MSNVDDEIQARIDAAKRKREQQREQRAAFAERRTHGLAARKRAKLARIPLPRTSDDPTPDAPPPAA